MCKFNSNLIHAINDNLIFHRERREREREREKGRGRERKRERERERELGVFRVFPV